MISINRFRQYARSSALCVVLCLFASPGFALECGDVLGPGGSFEMDADLQCDFPAGTPSLVLMDGAKLEMNDHTLTCLADPKAAVNAQGIWLEGADDEVSGGNIEGCGVAVDLRGNGGHHVSNLNVSGERRDLNVASEGRKLVNIQSNHNVVEGVVASLGDYAFAVFGDENDVMHNQSLSSEGDGFFIIGNRNRVIGNSLSSSGCSGFVVFGSNNLLVDNEGMGTLAYYCGGIFSIRGRSNRFEGNTARNSASDGFSVEGNDNVFQSNVATANAASGIHVPNGITGNQIIRNVASGNARFDLQDDNPNCDHNIWSDNQFGTANALCISEICPSGTRSVPVLNSPPAPQPIGSAVTTSGSAPSPPAGGGGAGGGGGGGGAIDWLTLLWLTGLAGMVAARGSAPGRRMDPDR